MNIVKCKKSVMGEVNLNLISGSLTEQSNSGTLETFAHEDACDEELDILRYVLLLRHQ